MSRRTKDTVKLSKSLSYLLRHGAEKKGFKLLPGGFLYVDDILNSQDFQSVTVADIEQVVENNDKKRFTLESDADTGRLKIRANQGHSIQVEDLDLKPITDASDYPVVVHGTYQRPFKSIAKEGLKRMGRIHIHFAPGEPGADGVISGMRKSCTVLIYLNLQKALQDGFQFFLSANNVILSPGNGDGVIPPVYFEKVIDRSTGEKIFQDGAYLKTESLNQVLENIQLEPDVMTAEDVAAEFDKKGNRRKKK
ncbi:tRNA 2'-phosphotransferase 1-like [Physella acuta]|uniref:tRNA 2'-phosphotransferase 1-like n=1 Tax=Physella acuta TaxID=109671 RepID=UPI0027DBC0DA|nr:tRNA 2'-phosphotransferase 1-like [Physella acuta]XP_059176465.1 tRNA 2'-phosphotransferase 1-like [Physella acuta]